MALIIAAQPIRDPFAGATKAGCDRLLTTVAEAKDGEIVAVEFAGTFTIEGGGSTGNAVESLNRVIRKSIKTRGSFPTDDAATKLIYLAIRSFE